MTHPFGLFVTNYFQQSTTFCKCTPISICYIFIQVSHAKIENSLMIFGDFTMSRCPGPRRPVDIWVVGAPQDRHHGTQDSSMASSNRINQDQLPHFSGWNHTFSWWNLWNPCLFGWKIVSEGLGTADAAVRQNNWGLGGSPGKEPRGIISWPQVSGEFSCNLPRIYCIYI
jgi:hypothetical protein